MMDKQSLHMIRNLMFRLLPIQVMLAALGAVNGIVSSYFASNYISVEAMTAVGLYGPVSMLLGAIGAMLSGGCAVICGKYLGMNQQEKLRHIFSMDMLVSTAVGLLFAGVFVFSGVFDFAGLFTRDPLIRPIFTRYLLGQAVGVVPMLLTAQLTPFLSIENKGNRATAAGILYIIANFVFSFLFIQVLHLQEFGLALASSLGLWVLFLAEAQYFTTKKAMFRFSFHGISWNELIPVIVVGFPGAAGYMYMTVRGLAVNNLLEQYTGAAGISAFAAANNLLNFFWAIPSGMQAVSRMLFSVHVGEEDRRSLTDIMRVMFLYFIPLMLVIDLAVIVLARPLAYLFYKDTASDVFSMTAQCFRILPLCMPFSIVIMHFTCYGQASGKQGFVNFLALMDGAVCVILFSFLLAPVLGIRGVCLANVLNGITLNLLILGYAWIHQKHIPRTMDELMVIPEKFGVPEKDRIDISVRTADEVVTLAERIQHFCQEKGIDEKRSYMAGLCMEEMDGNVVEHGFTKDQKDHTADIRVVYKDNKIILRIKDDCIPFDPKTRYSLLEDQDAEKNIGIRMVYSMTDDIVYQNLLGMNVLTITI